MAEDGTKATKGSELPKDVLAPSEGPRENLVVTAVKFLQNPKVRQSPLSQKKAFLESKGLTSDEIQLAIQRAGVTDDAPTPQGMQISPPYPQHPAAYANTALLPAQQPLPPPVPVSPWTRAREIAMTTAIVAAVSYAVYNLFQVYIRPWLLGKSQTDARLEKLETSIKDLHTSVANSNAQILETLKAIQESLTLQQNSSTKSSENSFRQETLALNDIKSEVASVKALLLSRRQFPPPPVTAPIIPAWQKVTPQGDQAQASTAQPEGVTDTGSEVPQGTEENTVQKAKEPLEESTPVLSQSSEESLPAEQSPLSDISIVQSTLNNNGFEMVKPNSDSDAAAEVD